MRACRARTVCLLPFPVPFSMLGHAPVTARASRCEKAAALAGEHRNPPHLKESWRLSRRTRSVLAKILAVRRQGDSPHVIAADHVRLRNSTWRGGVDMQAIVSAICAHAVHELRPLRWSLHRDKPGFTISQSPASTTTADSSKFAGTGP